MKSKVIEFPDKKLIKAVKQEKLRKVGALLNKIDSTRNDLSRFNTIEYVDELIIALTNLELYLLKTYNKEI